MEAITVLRPPLNTRPSLHLVFPSRHDISNMQSSKQ